MRASLLSLLSGLVLVACGSSGPSGATLQDVPPPANPGNIPTGGGGGGGAGGGGGGGPAPAPPVVFDDSAIDLGRAGAFPSDLVETPAGDLVTVDDDPPGVGLAQALQEGECGGLAGAGRADEGHGLTGRGLEGEVEHSLLGAGEAVGDVLVADADDARLASFYRRMLELNAGDIVHGSYGIEAQEVVLSDALELEDLDFSELRSSYESLLLAASSHLPGLADLVPVAQEG